MKNNKLEELRALAQKTVSLETKKADEALKNIEKRKKSKSQIESLEEGRGEQTDNVLQKIESVPKSKDDSSILANRRFQTVLREKDFDAIQDAKIYLLEQGLGTVSSNGIIQAALRNLVKDQGLVNTYLNVSEEDRRRKYLLIKK